MDRLELVVDERRLHDGIDSLAVVDENVEFSQGIHHVLDIRGDIGGLA